MNEHRMVPETKRPKRLQLGGWAVVALCVACGGDDEMNNPDMGSAPDARPADSGAGSEVDSGTMDMGAEDAGSTDLGEMDAGFPDMGVDMGSPDSGVPETRGVTLANDALANVLGTFDDPASTLASGWGASGAFADPLDADAWRGTTANPMAARVGSRAVGTCEIGNMGCDAPTGVLTSPPFMVSDPMLSFLMAGGDGMAEVGLEIIDSDGRRLLTHRSRSCAPSYIDADDDWQHVDLTPFMGQSVRVQLADRAGGACGFLSFDHLYLSATGRGPRVGTTHDLSVANVSTSTDAFDVLIATFDDARSLVADPAAGGSGWAASGVLANPTAAAAWAGTATTSNPAAARVGAQAVGTCEIGGMGCDAPTGELASPEFRVTRRYLNFLMAGGNGAANVGVEILDSSDAVLTGFVPNACAPSFIDGDEDWHFIDLEPWRGQMVKVRVYDRESGGCGFLSFDHFYLSDELRGPTLAPVPGSTPIETFDDARATVASGWTAEGAFAGPGAADAWTGTARRSNPNAARVGRNSVSTCEIGGAGCDGPTGELTSPLVPVSERYLNFAMGGGNGSAPVGLEVLDETGTVLATYTPNSCGPSYIDGRDDWHHIDLDAHRGRQVRLRFFDREMGGCGFVSFDHPHFSGVALGTP